jgi:hypothetical protein
MNWLWQVIDFLQAYNGAVTAVATVCIGVFTYVLARITHRQAKLTRESIDLARDEFVSTHRPKIVVRYFTPKSNEPRHETSMVVCRFVNAGVTRATVQHVNGIVLNASYPLRPGVDFDKWELKPPMSLMSGQEGSFDIGCDSLLVEIASAASQDERLSVEHRIFCVGEIIYKDDLGRFRKTGFLRSYDFKAKRWVKDQESEYEYAY